VGTLAEQLFEDTLHSVIAMSEVPGSNRTKSETLLSVAPEFRLIEQFASVLKFF
jgi:hypothetical protein